MKLSRLRAALIGFFHPACIQIGHDWSEWDEVDWSIIYPISDKFKVSKRVILELRICGRCSLEEERPKLIQFHPEVAHAN